MSKAKIILFIIITIAATIRGVTFRYEEGPILGPILFVTFNWAIFFCLSWAITKVGKLFAK